MIIIWLFCFSCDIPLRDLKVLAYFVCMYTMVFFLDFCNCIYKEEKNNKKKLKSFWKTCSKLVPFIVYIPANILLP